jgi:hypothetical protein
MTYLADILAQSATPAPAPSNPTSDLFTQLFGQDAVLVRTSDPNAPFSVYGGVGDVAPKRDQLGVDADANPIYSTGNQIPWKYDPSKGSYTSPDGTKTVTNAQLGLTNLNGTQLNGTQANYGLVGLATVAGKNSDDWSTYALTHQSYPVDSNNPSYMQGALDLQKSIGQVQSYEAKDSPIWSLLGKVADTGPLIPLMLATAGAAGLGAGALDAGSASAAGEVGAQAAAPVFDAAMTPVAADSSGFSSMVSSAGAAGAGAATDTSASTLAAFGAPAGTDATGYTSLLGSGGGAGLDTTGALGLGATGSIGLAEGGAAAAGLGAMDTVIPGVAGGTGVSAAEVAGAGAGSAAAAALTPGAIDAATAADAASAASAVPGASATPGASGSTLPVSAGSGLGSSLGSALGGAAGSTLGSSLLGAGGLAALLASFKQPSVDTSSLQTLADQMKANGTAMGASANALIPTVTTGNLPAGAQAGITQSQQSAIAAIKSKYSSMGLAGSTMETQDINAANQSAQIAAFNEANTLTQTGLTEAGVSQSELGGAATIYNQIMQEQLSADQSLQKSLSNFAAAMALGGSGTSAIGSALGAAGSALGSGLSSIGSTLSGLTSSSDPIAAGDATASGIIDTGATAAASSTPAIATDANYSDFLNSLTGL